MKYLLAAVFMNLVMLLKQKARPPDIDLKDGLSLSVKLRQACGGVHG
jgi:hypothetical protein